MSDFTINLDNNENRNNLLKLAQDFAEGLTRGKDKGIINQESGAGFALRENGDIAIVSNDFTQYQMSSSGIASETSMQSNLITNTRNMRLDHLAINRHRINPALWELTDFRQVDGTNAKVVGNLNMAGTVLVKAWEPTLGKYVLIRRPIRMPIFSTTLNIPDVPEAMDITINDITKDLMEYLMKENKENNE